MAYGTRSGCANLGALARGLLALPLLAPPAAMADRFDIVTFDAPPGWSRKAITDGLVFESPPAGAAGFCQVLLSRSRPLAVPLGDELDRSWSSLLERQTLAGEPATPEQQDLGNGVTIAQRVAPLRAGRQTYITMLNLLRKDDRLVMVVVSVADGKALDRCGNAIGEFIAGLRMDTAPNPPSAQVPAPTAGATQPPGARPPRSDPQLAARFGNSVVGTWRYAMTAVTVTLNAPTQTRNVIELRFARDGTYGLTYGAAVPGSSNFRQSETGSYRVEGQRIRMHPKSSGSGATPYTLDWFFGDHPDYRGNWGLILRSNTDWVGGGKDDWRTFKPAE